MVAVVQVEGIVTLNCRMLSSLVSVLVQLDEPSLFPSGL